MLIGVEASLSGDLFNGAIEGDDQGKGISQRVACVKCWQAFGTGRLVRGDEAMPVLCCQTFDRLDCRWFSGIWYGKGDNRKALIHQGNRTMHHFCCRIGFSMELARFLAFESSLCCDGHGRATSRI